MKKQSRIMVTVPLILFLSRLDVDTTSDHLHGQFVCILFLQVHGDDHDFFLLYRQELSQL